MVFGCSNMLNDSKEQDKLEEIVTMNLLDDQFIFCMSNYHVLFYTLDDLMYQKVFELNISVLRIISNTS